MVDEYALTLNTKNLIEHVRLLNLEKAHLDEEIGQKRVELDLFSTRTGEAQRELDALLRDKEAAAAAVHDFKVMFAEEQTKHARHNRDHDKEIAQKNDAVSQREKSIHERENASAQMIEAKKNQLEKLTKDIEEAVGLGHQLADGVDFLIKDINEKKLVYQEMQKSIEALRTQFLEDQGRYGKLIDLKIKQLADLDAEVLKKITETKEPRATLESDQKKLDMREQNLAMYESRLRLAWRKYFPGQDLRV